MAAVALIAAGCGGAAEPSAEADFDIYVPGEVAVVRAAVDADAPRVMIAVAQDAVFDIGPALGGNPNQYQIAVGPDESLYALDVISGDIRFWAADGTAGSWAATGESTVAVSPAPVTLGVGVEEILVASVLPGHIKVLGLDGTVLRDSETDTGPWRLSVLEDGSFVALQIETQVLGRYEADGDEVARYTVFQQPEADLADVDPRLWPQQDFVVGRERIYITTAASHRVSVVGLDGRSLWVLEGEIERTPIPEHISGRTLGRGRRAGRAAGATIDDAYAHLTWPEYYPALAAIDTDHEDRLYVFPYLIEADADHYPVDIYDSEGGLVVQGWLPFQGWQAFGDGTVYQITVVGDRVHAVRYRLQLPIPPGSAAGQ
jgi:hypothetical protein